VNPAEHAAPDLVLRRTGPWAATASNGRGPDIPVSLAGAADAYSPLELLQIALAACEALSADHRVAHALGPNAEVTTTARSRTDAAENRLSAIEIERAMDTPSLAPEKADRLVERVRAAVDRQCTVGRTLEAGVRTELSIVPTK
jgi:uncharacterized OsmC-like protein